MVGMDLSHNLLHGGIPEGLFELPSLEYLNLSYNFLDSQVPVLDNMLSLDQIPGNISSLENLTLLNSDLLSIWVFFVSFYLGVLFSYLPKVARQQQLKHQSSSFKYKNELALAVALLPCDVELSWRSSNLWLTSLTLMISVKSA
ncbi:hypothetical protein EZV62_024380 [Acer yangbiense]|uniref:Leucine-rich repeat-containing N-terminal plant-type domain-containing protein n=1 Tax=Acer yangbiense TaxID=1000413 RepID=A0A5C7GVH7_9ROSI|nr:hypothetical protein EZV62_024380 [Acer yangbiense]